MQYDSSGGVSELRFASIGNAVRIDPSARFYGAEHIRIGDNVRIDAFSMISAGPCGVCIGNNVHIAAGVYIFGSAATVTIESFAGISSRVAVYTATDDYVDGNLTGPTVPDRFRKMKAGPVKLGRHAIVGSGSVILPGVTLGFGASVGALTLVRKDVPDGQVVYGNPMQVMPKLRNVARLRELETRYLEEISSAANPS